MENIIEPEMSGSLSDAESAEDFPVATTGITTTATSAEDYTAEESAENSTSVTQEQLNGIVARETGKAIEKTLRELGFNGTGKGREQLKQFKGQLAEQAEQFSAQTEKLSQALAAAAEKDNEIAQLRESLNDEKAARMLASSGVGEQNIEKALTLVKGLVRGGGELSDAVAEITEKYPHFIDVKKDIPRFSAPTGSSDGFTAMKAVFRRK